MVFLVTGSAGFIGFHISKKLLETGHKVIGLDNLNAYYDVSLKNARNAILKKYPRYKFYKGDLADVKFLRRVFKKNKVDKICHLAAQAGVRYSLKNPYIYVQSNITGFVNLLEEAKNFDIKNIVYASSSSVYGNSPKTSFSENDKTDSPISLYGATKKSDEVIAHAYSNLYGLNLTGLRFFTVYGPWGRPDMMYFNVVNNIVHHKKIKVFNFGKMERDFTFVDDIVGGIISALNKSYKYEIFNLGNNRPVELKYFINCAEKELDKKAILEYVKLQKGDVIKTCASIRKSQKLLGFKPKIKVEDGIKKFIKWYKDYYKMN